MSGDGCPCRECELRGERVRELEARVKELLDRETLYLEGPQWKEIAEKAEAALVVWRTIALQAKLHDSQDHDCSALSWWQFHEDAIIRDGVRAAGREQEAAR